MDKKQLGGAAALLVVTAAVIACVEAGGTAQPPEMAQSAVPPETVRQLLKEHFDARYREGQCSAIYADLTHDGAEELIVLEMEADRNGEPVQLHGGSLPADSFNGGQVTVLAADGENGVEELYRFSCGPETGAWGALYLEQWEGGPALREEGAEGGERLVAFSGAAPEAVPEYRGDTKTLLSYDGQTLRYLDELFTVY